jgi:DNA polymerase-3 subunit epsilon
VNETLKLLLALIAFLVLVAGLELAASYAFYYVLEPESQQRLRAMLSPQAELLAELGVLRLAILGVVFAVVYQLYIRGPLKIVEGIRIILNAHPSHRLEPAGPPEIRRLTGAVNDLAERGDTRHNIELFRLERFANHPRARRSIRPAQPRLAGGMARQPLARNGLYERPSLNAAEAVDAIRPFW